VSKLTLPVERYLAQAIEQRSPGPVAWVDPSRRTPISGLEIVSKADCQINSLDPPDIPASTTGQSTPFELAVVIDPAAEYTRHEAERLLAYFRDFGARAVLVLEQQATTTLGGTSAYIALGFKRARGSETLDANYCLYEFDIHNYKPVPSWLNSKNWANPEQWGKTRW